MDFKAFGLNTATSVFANLAAGSFGKYVRSLPVDKLSAWLCRFGRAFGPRKLGRHWSELSVEEQSVWLVKIPILGHAHSDWIAPFQWVPRTLTFWEGTAPTLADVVDGEVTEMKPIPNPGEWYTVPGYMASTTIEGIHDRLGWRWDNIDGFYELSVSLKGVRVQNTWI